MIQVESRPRATLQDALTWLRTLDLNELGLRADRLSRSLLNNQAGYRSPQNLRLTAAGWCDASSGNPVTPTDSDVRIVDIAAELDATATYTAIQALSPRWVDGLVTSDITHFGLDPHSLREAGLRRLLGAHCEVYLNGARSIRGNHDWASALPILKSAAQAGLRLHVDLLYGEDETIESLAAQLLDIRQVHEESGAVDALVPIPHNAKRAIDTPSEITFGFDDMRLIATARLVLDKVSHIQVPWLPFGLKAAQMGLVFGADDMGPWCLDPGVTQVAHVATLLALRAEEITMAIKDSGREPVQWKGIE